MKRALAALLAALLGLLAALPAAAASDGGSSTLTLLPETSGSGVDASAAIVVEAMTGRVLYGWKEDVPLPMASTTKIMTALLALEQPDIDAVFTVDSAAIKIEGSSMGLREGDSASLRALAAGMLLSSGNDAANAAAVRISGSVPAFVRKMNGRAKELGLKNTSFVTPSGLDAEGHGSTAADLATLTRAALNNGDFAAICSQYKLRASYGNPPYERWLTNHNKLLNYYEPAIGVKTGFTRKAGRCLVSAAKKDGVTLICVTLNCPNDWKVHESLYERSFGLLSVQDLAKYAPSYTMPVTGGTKPRVKAAINGPARVPVPTDGVTIDYAASMEHFVYAPVAKGQYLGEVEILLDGVSVYRVTLTAAEDVPLRHEYKEEKSLKELLSGLFK